MSQSIGSNAPSLAGAATFGATQGSGESGDGGGGGDGGGDGATAPRVSADASVDELFKLFTDGGSRLNRIVEGMGRLDDETAAHTMATGTHDGGAGGAGGRVFTVTKQKEKQQQQQPTVAGASIVPRVDGVLLM